MSTLQEPTICQRVMQGTKFMCGIYDIDTSYYGLRGGIATLLIPAQPEQTLNVYAALEIVAGNISPSNGEGLISPALHAKQLLDTIGYKGTLQGADMSRKNFINNIAYKSMTAPLKQLTLEQLSSEYLITMRDRVKTEAFTLNPDLFDDIDFIVQQAYVLPVSSEAAMRKIVLDFNFG